MSEGTRSLNLKTVSQRVTRIHSEVIVLGFFQDVRPLIGLAADIDWIYDGILSRLILGRKIQGGGGRDNLGGHAEEMFHTKNSNDWARRDGTVLR